MSNPNQTSPESESTPKLADELKLTKPEEGKKRATKAMARYATRTALLTEMRLATLSPEDFAEYLIDKKRDDAVSASTLRRWLRLRDNDVAAQTYTLMGMPKPGRPRGMCNDALYWALPRWAETNKKNLKTLHDELKEWAKGKNFKVPSYSTFCRYANESSDEVMQRNQLGIKAYYEKHGLGVKHADGSSNDVWVTDACQLKLWIIDELGKLFRPWIVVFMDRASRLVMGWMICKHDVTSDDTITALKFSILPKKLSVGVNWGGKPKVVHSDNGSIFCSDLFKANLARLEIEASYSPPACPNANGRIERFFRTLGEDFVRGLEGSILGHFVSPGDKAQGLWTMLPQQLEKWLLNYNLMRIHSSLNATPYEVWNEKLKDLSLFNLDYKRINKEIYVEKEFPVTKQGVELLPGQFWISGALLGLRRGKVTVQMAPEGPANKVMAFFGTECLGELTRQDGGTEIAQELKKAFWDRQNNLTDLKQVLKTGFAQSNKHLGTPKRQKVSSEGSQYEPARKRPKRRPKKVAIKRTAITTGDSK